MPEVGEPFQAADWFRTPDERDKVRRGIEVAFSRAAEQANVLFGPIAYQEMTPDDPGVPPPPSNWDLRGVKLLLGTAHVLMCLPDQRSAFIEELDEQTLHRLRESTRRLYVEHNPGAPPLSEGQVDAIIAEIGPGSAAKVTKSTH